VSEAARTVLSCPGCQSWQIDYDTAAMASLSRATFGADGFGVDASRFHAALEEELGAHLATCPAWWSGAEPPATP
jgi:hypothetical protein